MKNAFLFADPVFAKYTTVYKKTNDSLEMIDFSPPIDIVENNYKTIIQHNLPMELVEEIIKELFLDYLLYRQGSFAVKLATISKRILKLCCNLFFKTDVTDRSVDMNYRLTSTIQLLDQTNDHLIDLVAHPNGHNSGLIFSVGCSVNPVHGKIQPWYFDGDSELLTMQSPSVYCLSTENNPEPKYVAEIITGPNHYNLIYIRGKALKNGLVHVSYFKSPIIVFQLLEFVPYLDVTIDMLTEPSWKAFGNLARAFFGKNAGIFVSVTGDGLGMWETGVPAIFEI